MVDQAKVEAARRVKQALDRLETRFPDSHAVRVLHGRLGALLELHRDELGEEEFVTLGGGTPKTPPEEE